MATITSNKINVFPATRRGGSKPLAKLMSEQALVGITNRLIDLEGFVISDTDVLTDDAPLEFNLFGYYFSIEDPVSSIGLGTTYTSGSIYAHIELVSATADDGIVYHELWGQDDNNLYTGLVIDNALEYTAQHSGVVKTLKLAQLDNDGNWKVPEESKIRFSKDSLDLSVIDGGVIE